MATPTDHAESYAALEGINSIPESAYEALVETYREQAEACGNEYERAAIVDQLQRWNHARHGFGFDLQLFADHEDRPLPERLTLDGYTAATFDEKRGVITIREYASEQHCDLDQFHQSEVHLTLDDLTVLADAWGEQAR